MKKMFLIFLILQGVSWSYGQAILKNPGTVPTADTKATMKSVIQHKDPDGILNCNYLLFENALADAYRKAGVPINYIEDLYDAIDASWIAPVYFQKGEMDISVGPNPTGDALKFEAFRGNRAGEQAVYASTGKPVMSVDCWNILMQLIQNVQKVITSTESDGRVTNFYVSVLAGNGNGNNNGNEENAAAKIGATTTATTQAACNCPNYSPPTQTVKETVYVKVADESSGKKVRKHDALDWYNAIVNTADLVVDGIDLGVDLSNQGGGNSTIPDYAGASGNPFGNQSTGTGTNTGGSAGTNGPWTNTSGGSGGGYVLNGVYYPQ